MKVNGRNPSQKHKAHPGDGEPNAMKMASPSHHHLLLGCEKKHKKNHAQNGRLIKYDKIACPTWISTSS